MAGQAVGILFPAALLMFLYRWSMIGAGDIKLLMVCGAFLGFRESVRICVWSFMIGGAISIFLLIKNRNLIRRLNYFTNYVDRVLRSKKLNMYYAIWRPKKGETLHFSLCIFLAVCKVLLF